MSVIGALGLLLGGSLLNAGAQFGSQAWQQDFNRTEAEKSRTFSAEEAQKARDFEREQASILRDFNAYQAQISRDFSALEAQKVRDFDKAEAEKARQFNMLEAQKARDWQTNMSNTAYQRQMSDLKAAGINPVLAATLGGASSGSGAVASGTGASVGGVPASASGVTNAMPHSSQAQSSMASAGLANVSHIADGIVDFALNSALKMKDFENKQELSKIMSNYKKDILFDLLKMTKK